MKTWEEEDRGGLAMVGMVVWCREHDGGELAMMVETREWYDGFKVVRWC